jgi:hypothetical protein
MTLLYCEACEGVVVDEDEDVYAFRVGDDRLEYPIHLCAVWADMHGDAVLYWPDVATWRELGPGRYEAIYLNTEAWTVGADQYRVLHDSCVGRSRV